MSIEKTLLMPMSTPLGRTVRETLKTHQVNTSCCHDAGMVLRIRKAQRGSVA